MAPKTVPNGSAETPIEVSTLPPVVGINFGNSYASIAVFTKEGLAECIANEDGERQIACAVAFQGEEMYIGNQAKHQLIKNAQNTITGFRNLLGKKFSEISTEEPTKSAPVIQHPEIADEPAYRVEVLQSSPSPLPVTATNTPAASHAPTPRSEPLKADRFLTVSEVTSIFLKSLVQSASDFLGKKIEGAVISVPSWFSPAQRSALEKAAEIAGVHILQLLDEAGAAASITTTGLWCDSENLRGDRTQLVVDLGSSSLSLALLSIREGLAYTLASSSTPSIGGDQIDSKLIKFFAKDFTKKTKIPLTVGPATELSDKRAEAKLLLAVEHTKRTISASPGAATCSVESLKDGFDFTGSINRMRFDMEVRPIYAAVTEAVHSLVTEAGFDPYNIDEIVYIGGSASLPGLDEHLCLTGGFSENVSTPFTVGSVMVADPTTVLARGCALQAELIWEISEEDEDLKKAFVGGVEGKATNKTIGILFPDPTASNADSNLAGTWIPVVPKETPLPARRIVSFDVALPDGGDKKFAFEVWEITEGIRVEKVKPPKAESDDEGESDEEEEEEEVEIKHKTISKESYLGSVQLEAKLAIQSRGKEDKGKWSTNVQVQFVIGKDDTLEVEVKETGSDDTIGSLKVPA